MDRLTQNGESSFIVGCDAVKACKQGFCGVAIDKLALFEDIVQRVLIEQEQCSAKMNELRIAGKEKTVAFKELMIKKLNNINLIDMLKTSNLI